MNMRRLWMCPILVGAAALAVSAGGVRAAPATVPLKFAKIYIEYNATAVDLGFHISLDGEDWKRLKIFNPAGREVFDVSGSGKGFGRFGMTELFFEGAEPSLAEVPREQLLALFPAGQYRFVAKGVEGETQVALATLTHNVPDGPAITAPALDAVVDRLLERPEYGATPFGPGAGSGVTDAKLGIGPDRSSPSPGP